jgi:hypothetical protein
MMRRAVCRKVGALPAMRKVFSRGVSTGGEGLAVRAATKPAERPAKKLVALGTEEMQDVYGPVNPDSFKKEQKERSKIVLKAWGLYNEETHLEDAFRKLNLSITRATSGPIGSDAVRRIDKLWEGQVMERAPRDLWASLLELYSERMPWKIEAFLVDMRAYGVPVTSDTYSFVLHAYMKLGEIALVRLTLAEMRAGKVPPSSSSCLEIMQYLTEKEGASSALAFFDGLRDTNALRTLPMYSVALGIVADAGDVAGVVTRFHQMKEEKTELVADRKAWQILIALNGRQPNVPQDVQGRLDALLVFLQMEQIGVTTAFAEAAVEESVQWLDDATEAALTCLAHLQERKIPTTGARVCLIGVLASRGDFESALRVLSGLRAKGLTIGFTEEQHLINGFVALHKEAPKLEDVIALLDKLRGVSVTPRQHSFYTLMECFIHDDDALSAVYHRMLSVHKVRPDIRICNLMLSYYKRTKQGVALAAFIRRMRQIWAVELDAASYGIMVEDYFETGSVDECLELVAALQKTKGVVDENLIKKVIELCSREGRMGDADEHLFAKLETFDLLPTQRLWGAVIDGWVQCGNIDRAIQELVMMRDPWRHGLQPSPFIGASLCGEVMRASGAFELASMPKTGKKTRHHDHDAHACLTGMTDRETLRARIARNTNRHVCLSDYSRMIMPQLKEVLTERGLSKTGTKAQLLARLEDDWRRGAAQMCGATGVRAYEFFVSLGGQVGAPSVDIDSDSSFSGRDSEVMEGEARGNSNSSSSDDSDSSDSSSGSDSSDSDVDGDLDRTNEPSLILEACSNTTAMSKEMVSELDHILAAWLSEDRPLEPLEHQIPQDWN